MVKTIIIFSYNWRKETVIKLLQNVAINYNQCWQIGFVLVKDNSNIEIPLETRLKWALNSNFNDFPDSIRRFNKFVHGKYSPFSKFNEGVSDID